MAETMKQTAMISGSLLGHRTCWQSKVILVTIIDNTDNATLLLPLIYILSKPIKIF